MQSGCRVKSIHIGLFLLVLSACGGGGSGSSASGNTPPATSPVSQTIAFTNPGPVSLLIGSTLTNTASGPGSGAVSYSSSNPAAVSVDTAGVAAVVGRGSAVITATKAADAHYLAANASYTINSVTTVAFAAWVGSTNTQVNFSTIADGMAFYRSSEANCDMPNYGSCVDGQLDILSGVPIIDSASTLAKVGYYVLAKDSHQAALTVSTEHFSGRTGHSLVTYHNQLWLIGGTDSAGQKNDVWSSSDGVSWTLQTGAAAFSARSGQQVVEYNNQLWLIGGGFKNDVWVSSDGITWVQKTIAAPFSARTDHQVVTHSNQMWLIGGNDDGVGYNARNDVWSSSDGVTWTQRTPAAAFSPRSGHKVVAYNNHLWLIGGADYSTLYNDVWSSSDGITWTQQTAAAAFSARNGHQVAVHKNQLWLIGGYSYDLGFSYQNDVWSSSDGITWTQQTAAAAFSARAGHQVAVSHNQLWLIGGLGFTYQKDVWSSSDGIAWTEQTPTAAAFSARSSHQVVAYKNQFWLIGGNDTGNLGYKNDVWSSSDGINWTQQTAAAAFPSRSGHKVVVFNDLLWVIGGYSSNTGYLNDVWSSSDGINWTQVTSGAMFSFSPRSEHQVAVYNNQLWLIGGRDSLGYQSGVWSSGDGHTWGLHTPTPSFTARIGHQLVVYANQLWLIGGEDDPFGFSQRNDIWSSSDGINWTQRTAAAAFSVRTGHHVVVNDNQMWLIGGAVSNDIWSSSDGINWTQRIVAAAFSARTGFQVVVHDNQWWLIGGDEGSTSTNSGLKNDVWWSNDGLDWRLGFRGTFNFLD